MADLDHSATTRALMISELLKLRGPLTKLKSLSFCLDDDPEDVAIRKTIATILVRTSTLEDQIGLPPPESPVLGAAFDLDCMAGTT